LTPVVTTAAQAKSLVRDGQLVRVPGLTIVSVPGGTGSAFNVVAADAADDTLQIRVAGLNTGLSRSSFVVGNRYDVSGVLTQFRGTAQIKIRDTADLQAGATITMIAAVRASENGTAFTVSGRLSVPPAAFPSGPNSELWVQDATGGIAVFSVPTADSLLYQLGNTVEVTGTLGAFNNQQQLGAPTVVRTGTGSPVAPVSVTGVQVNNLANEGRLVSLAGFTVTTIGGGTGASFNVDGTTADGATVRIRVSGALRGLSRANFTVGSTYTVTGILTQFRGAAQIKVRFASDITP
jgi:DNA/RNA endonuclease YhcR with UshA esterase domain